MPTQFLRKAAVAARYQITIWTMERWLLDGRLPPATTWRGRYPFWSENDLDACDRAATAASRPKRSKAHSGQIGPEAA